MKIFQPRKFPDLWYTYVAIVIAMVDGVNSIQFAREQLYSISRIQYLHVQLHVLHR